MHAERARQVPRAAMFLSVCLLAMSLLAIPPSSTAALTPRCKGLAATIIGTNQPETLLGTSSADVIIGLGGGDTIKGLGGRDTICGAEGRDEVHGGGGGDLADGGPGNDTVTGEGGIDQLLGGTGNDHLSDDSPGADSLTGGGDIDTCSISPDDIVSCEFDPTDLVVFAPYQGSVSPGSIEVATTSEIGAVDLYVILDRSGSMLSEISTIKSNLATVVSNLRCPPQGTGDPALCVTDLWAGAGTVGYSGSGAAAFQNWVDVQQNPNFGAVPTTEPSSTNSTEPLTFSVYATITGAGGANYGMPSVPPRSTCDGSPAAVAGFVTFGYPCFRQGTLPIVVLATDEPPLSSPTGTVQNPAWTSVVRVAMNSREARLVGLVGDGAAAGTTTDLQTMATDTGAVDATNGNAPLVFDGAGANASTALQNGILSLVNGVPLDVRAKPADDPSDAVDAVASFVDRIEVKALGNALCPSGLTTGDADSDGFDDTYVGVAPGTPICWKLKARANTSVPATSGAQVFRATIDITVDGISLVEQREVFFVVPAIN